MKKPSGGESGYFSINGFIIDHQKHWIGQPKTLRQITTLNGKTDSNFVDIEKVDWHTIYSMFSATDIRDSSFTGKYRESHFMDDMLDVQSFVYEAMTPELFTRQVQFSVSPETGRVVSIYIETADASGARKRWQKLYYSVNQLLQIEEQEVPMLGKARNLRVQYLFEYD